jgi:nucleoside-diphosphate-sugar epimerase
MLEHLEPESFRPSRVVILGAGGFVGGAIVRRLAATSVPVLALGRHEVDLLAPAAASRLTELLRPDDAVVAAAAIAPVKSIVMLEANMALLKVVSEALARVPPAHLINIGSDAVFADGPLPLDESSYLAPTSLHGVMHLAREIAFAAHSGATPVVTLRPTLIYGSADPHNGYGPNRFLRLALEGRDIMLFGEGEERRDHVAVEDVAELTVRVLLRRSRGSLNVASGQVWSFREIASMAAALAKPPVAVRGQPRQGLMPHGGYRSFDPRATLAAFPDFGYGALPTGLARVHSEMARCCRA